MRSAVSCTLLFVLMLLTDCGRQNSSASLRIAQEAELYSLNPFTAADAQSRAVLCNVYEALVEFDREMKVRPALATRWTSEDDRTWVFDLRAGVKFHDGKPLKAEDVKQSLEYVAHDPVSGWESVEVIGDLKIRMRSVRPDPLLLNRLTQILIVPARQIDFETQPVGTGPYRVVERTAQTLTLESFREYWRGNPSIERLEFRPIQERVVAEELRERKIDLFRLLPSDAVSTIERVAEYKVVGRPGLAVVYLWFNCGELFEGRPNPFSNPLVRRAVSLALDREALVRRLGGKDIAAHQLIPDGVFGSIPGREPLPHGVALARETLLQAGMTKLEARLAHPPGAAYTRTARIIREMLEPAGIRIIPEERSLQKILEGRHNQSLQFFLLSWTFDDGDAWTFLMASLHSRRGAGDLRSTNPGYSNPVLDQLIENSQGATRNLLMEQYEAILKIAMEDAPIIPVYRRYDNYTYSRRFHFEPRLDGKLVALEIRRHGDTE